MRRSEFEVNDPAEIAQTLEACEYGVLSIISQGEPYGSAVNFVYLDGCIYFHGSREGRRAASIGRGAGASFLAVRPLAFIPSYFSDTRSACPATQFFASVHVAGTVAPQLDAEAKSEALNALMGKMQPEGGYEAITPHNPIYAAMLEKTGVYCLRPDTVSLKIKAGQNLSSSRFAALSQRLVQREGVADGVTLEMMGKLHDHEH